MIKTIETKIDGNRTGWVEKTFDANGNRTGWVEETFDANGNCTGWKVK